VPRDNKARELQVTTPFSLLSTDTLPVDRQRFYSQLKTQNPRL
jgi:hypothetical protein